MCTRAPATTRPKDKLSAVSSQLVSIGNQPRTGGAVGLGGIRLRSGRLPCGWSRNANRLNLLASMNASAIGTVHGAGNS
jgi:hypothetical protein